MLVPKCFKICHLHMQVLARNRPCLSYIGGRSFSRWFLICPKKKITKKKKKSFTGYSLVGLERLKIHFFRAVSSMWYVISKTRMPIEYPIFLGLVSRLGINYGATKNTPKQITKQTGVVSRSNSREWIGTWAMLGFHQYSKNLTYCWELAALC